MDDQVAPAAAPSVGLNTLQASVPAAGGAQPSSAHGRSAGSAAEDQADFDQDLARAVAQMRVTADDVKPAVQAALSRRLMHWLARSSVKVNFILGACLVGSVYVNVVLVHYATNPVREYFGTDNGRYLFSIVPLSRPYMTVPAVIQYAKDTLNASFALDFANYRAQLEGVRPRYTRDGFASFLESLNQSNILDLVSSKRMNLSNTTGTGVLIKDGVEDGLYVWYVEVPLELRFAGQTTEMPPQRFRAVVRVVRVSTLDNIQGISVGQLVTRPLAGNR